MIDESIEDLSRDIAQAQEKMKQFKIQRDNQYVYFLGITGSGKSTTINYLLHGNSLQFQKNKGNFYISPPQGTVSPAIGNSPGSCTVIPEIFKDQSINNKSIFYVDPAGFMDTNGAHQETINSYSNARMFRRGVQTKLVIVMEHSTLLSGKGHSVTEVIKRIFQLFPRDFDRLTNSISLLITKVSLADYQQEDIKESVRQITETNKNLTIQCKTMIQAIIENHNIFILPKPTFLSANHLQKLKNTLCNLKPTMLSTNATLSLSPESKCMIDQFANMTVYQMKEIQKKIKNLIQLNFVNKSINTIDQFDKTIQKLKVALNILITEGEDSLVYQSFSKFASKIQLPDQLLGKVMKCFQKMEFCNSLHAQIKQKVSLVESIINSLRQAVGNLQTKMMKLASKKQMQEANKRHNNEIQIRNQQYNQLFKKITQDAKRREQQARQEIRSQQQFFENLMRQSSKKHAQQIRILRNQISNLTQRLPPPPPPPPARRHCLIV